MSVLQLVGKLAVEMNGLMSLSPSVLLIALIDHYLMAS